MKEPETRKKSKSRRVSHRRELAVVTLAAVASISGVGGLLAAHQNAPQTAQPVSAGERSALFASVRPGDDRGVVPTSFRGDDEHYETDDEGERVAAPVNPKPKVVPSWSAPSQNPAATVSQGS